MQGWTLALIIFLSIPVSLNAQRNEADHRVLVFKRVVVKPGIETTPPLAIYATPSTDNDSALTLGAWIERLRRSDASGFLDVPVRIRPSSAADIKRLASVARAAKSRIACHAACSALAWHELKAIPFLIDLVGGEEERVSAAAHLALQWLLQRRWGRETISPTARREVTDHLVAALEAADARVRLAAAEGLTNCRFPFPGEILSKLCTALEDENEDVRFHAAGAIGRFRPRPKAAEVAVPLFRCAGSRTARPRWAARSTLCSAVCFETPSDIEIAIDHLSDKNPNIRAVAAVVLEFNSRLAKPSVPALAKALGDEVPHVRHQAAIALGEIAPETPGVVAGLMEVVEQFRPAPFRIPKSGETEGPPWRQLRVRAIGMLGRLGRAASAAFPLLMKRFPQSSGFERSESISALPRLAPSAETVRPALAEAMEDDGPETTFNRLLAAFYWLRLGGDKARAVPVLIAALDAPPNPFAQGLVVDVARMIGLRNPVIVPALRAALGCRDRLLRTYAAGAIADLPVDAIRKLKRELEEAAKDAHEPVRAQARRALAKIR